MKFFHDDSFLLAVFRDHHFSVFSIDRTGTDEIKHKLIARQEAHKRIIWSCSWNPFSHEFATCSRNKTVKIWAVDGGTLVRHILTLPTFPCSVTALSWLGLDRESNSGLLAVGMENGLIELRSLSIGKGGNDTKILVKATLVLQLDPFMCHASTVQRLAWRDPERREDDQSIQLASCGADHFARAFAVKLM
ncbi:hypothetical protein Droror1_Dr00013155 [Drosera rotundifolia]